MLTTIQPRLTASSHALSKFPMGDCDHTLLRAPHHRDGGSALIWDQFPNRYIPAFVDHHPSFRMPELVCVRYIDECPLLFRAVIDEVDFCEGALKQEYSLVSVDIELSPNYRPLARGEFHMPFLSRDA